MQSRPPTPGSSAPLRHWPDVDHVITEDDTPVDNRFAEIQQRLLVNALAGWSGPPDGRTYVAASNVGVFPNVNEPALVPDMFLSLDVTWPPEGWAKRNRSYFIEGFGKPPELVVEVVSNDEGGEDTRNLEKYAQMGVRYYIIHDPHYELSSELLRVYELDGDRYRRRPIGWLESVWLRMTMWPGEMEGLQGEWLRWTDQSGAILLTGDELAARERDRADAERTRADEERLRADEERLRADDSNRRAEDERQRAERLAERLRALGVDPSEIL
jgi:Uma2 family endonuclease